MSNSIVYERVTNAILDRLSKGEIPWRQPWAYQGEAGAPRNFVTGKAYRGVNIWLLSHGYALPFWLTFNQARTMKATIRKGEKGTTVVFWNIHKKTDKQTGEETKIFLLRYYVVFNIAQCDGIPQEKIDALKAKVGIDGKAKPAFSPIDSARAIVDGWEEHPPIGHGGDSAFYRPSTDSIQMPSPETFKAPEFYYSTLFHELTHSTGAASRLNREGIVQFDRFGSERYSKEELIAEFGASFLCGMAGIDREPLTENTVAYLQNWARKLQAEPKLFVQAAGQAQRASDYILNGGKPVLETEPEAETAHA